MKSYLVLPAIAFTFLQCVSASTCTTQSLNTYLNNGDPFICGLASGAITIGFHQNILPAYVGLSVLAGDDGADPSAITVAPGASNLDFEGNFSASGLVASSQTELVQFMVHGTNALDRIGSTTYSLDNPVTSAGPLGAGTGLAIGQELICVGGSFTSLPTGLLTSVTNGLLGTGAFGCNGTALIGTVDDTSGPLNLVTSLVGLPNLTGVTNSVTFQLSPFDTSLLDVIKIQALIGVTTGSASTQGFGDSFTTFQGAPEPSAGFLMLGGIALLLVGGKTRKRSVE